MRREASSGGRKDRGLSRRRGFRRVALLLVAIAAIFAYGVAGYMVLGFGFVDALYMTSLALTTAGFTPAGELDQAAKVLTVSIAVLGVSAFLAVLGVLTTALAARQFTAHARRRRMERRTEALRDHHIICAYGRVGRTVAREYEAEGVPFVVIDSKEELEEQMQADGILYIIADPSSEAVLRRAGVERARGLVCAVDSDATNVYIALTARSLNPDIFIVARASDPSSAERLFRAGVDRVVSPYVTSGRHMALVSLRPKVVDFFEVVGLGGREARLDELAIEEGSPLVGRPLAEVCGPAVPLLLRRGSGEVVPNPRGDERLAPGDLVFLFGEPGALRAIEEALG
jgi:voltage-gated potassium channel